MKREIVLATAYLPPIEYFARIKESDEIYIEREENYLKQSYRNRCIIIAADKPQVLTVPVFLGSLHKTHIKDIRIDYSKRWQHVHLGALMSAYGSSPFFIHYYDIIEKIILGRHEYLLDLNMEFLNAAMKVLKLERRIAYTDEFQPAGNKPGDYRYSISPKIKSIYKPKEYIRVFGDHNQFIDGISIADLIFNAGPDASFYL
jgi:hypothetical protein